MSTNFYAKHPGMSDDEQGLHIGKRSAGWQFLFRAHDKINDDPAVDYELRSTDDWRHFLAHPWVRIVSEYGTPYTVDEFFRSVVGPAPQYVPFLKDPLAVDPAAPEESARLALRQWTDRQGYPFAGYEFC